MSEGLSKTVGHHGWLTTKHLKLHSLKCTKAVLKKRYLDQKINDSKPHICSLSLNFRFSSRKSQN